MGSCSHLETVVEKLIRNFFNSNLNFSLSVKETEEFTWNEQEAFLNNTLNNELLEKYPVSKEFSRLFLKKIITILEPNQEIHDDFYKHLCYVMKSDGGNIYHYKHYVISNNFSSIITMKETKNLVVNGTTGFKTWQGAIMLSDWALTANEEFENKVILELGSGIGFTGITISKLCNVKSYTFTDCHDDVLRTIHANIEINFPHVQRVDANNKTVYLDDYKKLEVVKLDWNNISDIPIDVVPDVLIGADIIYDPAIIDPLCNVVKVFLNRNRKLHVFFMNIMRNEDTYRQFLDALDVKNLAYEHIITLSNPINLEWDESANKYFLKILNKS